MTNQGKEEIVGTEANETMTDGNHVSADNKDMNEKGNGRSPEELLSIMQSGLSGEELRDALSDFHEADIAEELGNLTKDERRHLYRALGVDAVSEIFAYLEDPEEFLREIGVEKSADILEKMDADDAVDVLETLPEDYQEELVQHMESEAQEDIVLIQSYEDDEIGSMMTTNFILVHHGLSVKESMKELVKQSGENDNISTIYLENNDGTFYGAIDLKDLIRAREGSDLEDITVTSYPTVLAHAKIDDEIERLRGYSEDSIPVLDEHGVIIGVITANDLIEAVDEALDDDYAKLAGLTHAEDLDEGLFQSVKKRIPWLIALLALGLGVSTVVGAFQGVVEKIALVVCFQSMILDMAGNSGTQSLGVTIRVLTSEDLSGKDKFRFFLKELRVGVFNGMLLGIGAFALVGAYIMLFKGDALTAMSLSRGYAFLISGCVGLSLWLAMIIASMVGTLIPMFFHKIKVDPAVASGPLITTINDMVAVVTYYGMVWFLLLNVLHLAG